ncbi:ankyrin repeat-containing domain protein [Mycena latifolia]|nr:ankyrin repeat-containing domain protein [Mycena latifolia]
MKLELSIPFIFLVTLLVDAYAVPVRSAVTKKVAAAGNPAKGASLMTPLTPWNVAAYPTPRKTKRRPIREPAHVAPPPARSPPKEHTSAKFSAVQGRAVATTQFHATCRIFAASIASAVKGGTFALQPERIWPNEFMRGVLRDAGRAQRAAGATFLASACQDNGGIVVIDITRVNEVAPAAVSKGQLCGAFQRFLKKQAVADDGIGADDNPAVGTPAIALPTAAQLAAMTSRKGAPSPVAEREAELQAVCAALATADVVAGAGPLTATQRVLTEDAGDALMGMPAFSESFNQVDKGEHTRTMTQLKFVTQKDVPRPAALQAASKKGHKDVVSMPIEHGAEVNAQGGECSSALQAASEAGDKDIVMLLIEHGADVNAQCRHYGSILQAASLVGQEDIVCTLIEHGADVNVQGGLNGSPLQAACWTGRKVVCMLIEHAVNKYIAHTDVNVQGGKYGSALQAVCAAGHEDIVGVLIEHGADVNTQGGLLLIKHGANVNALW